MTYKLKKGTLSASDKERVVADQKIINRLRELGDQSDVVCRVGDLSIFPCWQSASAFVDWIRENEKDFTFITFWKEEDEFYVEFFHQGTTNFDDLIEPITMIKRKTEEYFGRYDWSIRAPETNSEEGMNPDVGEDTDFEDERLATLDMALYEPLSEHEKQWALARAEFNVIFPSEQKAKLFSDWCRKQPIWVAFQGVWTDQGITMVTFSRFRTMALANLALYGSKLNSKAQEFGGRVDLSIEYL